MPGNINCLENQRVRNQQKRLRSTDQPSSIFSSTLITVCILHMSVILSGLTLLRKGTISYFIPET